MSNDITINGKVRRLHRKKLIVDLYRNSKIALLFELSIVCYIHVPFKQISFARLKLALDADPFEKQ